MPRHLRPKRGGGVKLVLRHHFFDLCVDYGRKYYSSSAAPQYTLHFFLHKNVNCSQLQYFASASGGIRHRTPTGALPLNSAGELPSPRPPSRRSFAKFLDPPVRIIPTCKFLVRDACLYWSVHRVSKKKQDSLLISIT